MYIGKVEPYIDGVTTWGGKGDKSCTGHQGRWCKYFYLQQCIKSGSSFMAWRKGLAAISVHPAVQVEWSSSCRPGSAHLPVTTLQTCVGARQFQSRSYNPTVPDTASRLCWNCPVSPCVLIPHDNDRTFPVIFVYCQNVNTN